MTDRVVLFGDVCQARGGATALALMSVRGLRARGIPVTFITGDNGDNPELRSLGVEIVPVNQTMLLQTGPRKAFIRGLYNSKTIEIVGGWIKRHDTRGTVYHVHTWSQVLSPALFQILKPVAERLLISAHDFFLVCPNGGYALFGSGEVCELRPMSAACITTSCDKRGYAHKLWRVARQGVRMALFDFKQTPARILAVHGGMRPGLERGGIPRDSISVLRNPIRPFSTNRITAECNDEFVFIGRLDPEKGPDLVAKAARAIGAKLRIIGDGPMRESLQRDFPQVHFVGHQPPEAIASMVASARALVMPSRYPEPFGLVAGEALWSGLPVILPNTALMAPEIASHGAGVSYDPQDPNALAAAMRHLLEDDCAVSRMSRNAYDNTRELGTLPEEWIDALVNTYEDVCSAEAVQA